MSGKEQTLWSGHPTMLRADPVKFAVLVLLVPFGIGAIGLFIWWLSIEGQTLTITDRRTVLRLGLLSKSTNEVRHVDVRNIQVQQTIFQRLVGSGSIGISCSGQAGVEIQIAGISDPEHVSRLIRDRQDHPEQPVAAELVDRPATPPNESKSPTMTEWRLPDVTLSEANKRRLVFGLAAAAMLLGAMFFARQFPWLAVSSGLLTAIIAVACFVGAKEGLWEPYVNASLSRQRFVTAVVAVYGISLMSFTVPAFQERSRVLAHAAQVRDANEAVAAAVRSAQMSFTASRYDDAEQELTAAISIGLATNMSAAKELLIQVQQVRSEVRARQQKREDEAAALQAEHVSRALWQSVESAIQTGNFVKAASLVSGYLDSAAPPRDRDRATAAQEALRVITSPKRVVAVLDALTDDEFADFKERGVLPTSAAVDEPLLSEAYGNAIHAQLPAAEQLRAERIAKQKADAQRAASEKRKRALEDKNLAAAKAAAETSPPPQPKDRYNRVLRSDDSSPMAVCVDKDSFDRYTKACVREDFTLTSQMVSDNLVWEVASGTRVRLTAPEGVFSSEIEIRGGKHAGKRGIVASDFLKE